MAPDRIVSLAPSNTEILHAVGAGDRVVATTAVCDHPPAARDLPSVGGWTNPDVDAVAEHDPDLVLASDELQDRAVDRVRDAGIDVRQFTPRRLRDVFNTVKAVGEIVGAEGKARDLVDRMNERVRATAAPSAAVRVYTEEWHDPPMAGGNWVPDMVRFAGGKPLLDAGERSRKVDAEEVRDFDPDHIVLHPCGYDDAADPGTVAEREGWQDLRAVDRGNVHVVDDTLLNRPGPRLVEGLARLRELVQGSEQS